MGISRNLESGGDVLGRSLEESREVGKDASRLTFSMACGLREGGAKVPCFLRPGRSTVKFENVSDTWDLHGTFFVQYFLRTRGKRRR